MATNFWMYTTKLTPQNLQEALVNYLPTNQQPHIGSKAYAALCDSLWDYLNSDIDTKTEKMQLLSHARAIFSDYCLTIDRQPCYADIDSPEAQEERPWYPTL